MTKQGDLRTDLEIWYGSKRTQFTESFNQKDSKGKVIQTRFLENFTDKKIQLAINKWEWPAGLASGSSSFYSVAFITLSTMW